MLAGKNCRIYANTDNNQGTLAYKSFINLVIRYSPTQSLQLNNTSKFSYYLKVLVFFILLPRRKANYNSIFVIFNCFKKMLHNKLM